MIVKIYKLVDGSELIGKSVEDRNSYETYTVKDPLEIKYRMGLDGMASAVMTKYNYFGDEDRVKLNASGVITSYVVNEKYTKVYEESLDVATKPPEEPVKRASEAIMAKISGNNTVH